MLLFVTCRQEQEFTKNSQVQNQLSIYYKKLSEIPGLQESVNKVKNQIHSNSLFNKGIEDLDLDEDNVLVMDLMNSGKNISIVINTDASEDAYFVMNLNIIQHDGIETYIITKYIPADGKPFYSYSDFVGTIEFYDLDGNLIEYQTDVTGKVQYMIMIDCYMYIFTIYCCGEGTFDVYNYCDNGGSGDHGTDVPDNGGPGNNPGGGTGPGEDNGGNPPTVPNIPTEDVVKQKFYKMFLAGLLDDQYDFLVQHQDYNEFIFYYLEDNNFSPSSKDIMSFAINLFSHNTDDNNVCQIDWFYFQNWLNWYNNYKLTNTNANTYFKNNINDLEYLYFPNFNLNDPDDVEAANTVANVITDYLIAEKNGTLGNLSSNWPTLEALKQKVKHWISKGIYTTAKYTRDYIVIPMNTYAINNPNKVNWLNENMIDKIRIDAVAPIVNFNPNTMNWGDLFNIWLFELTPISGLSNTIFFSDYSNVVNGNDIYNPATNAVKNFPKGNPSILPLIQSGLANGTFNVGSPPLVGFFNYDVSAFYSTISDVNIGIQMLGSYPITATVLTKSGNTATVQFTINNNLSWESATRFIKGTNGNIGMIDNTAVGEGLHLGGTITNIYTWTETITF
jgi:hypothetical protein